jgi:magnesium chelatase family protein
MSLATIHSRALLGVDALKVTVETHLSNGLPAFAIVGLPETGFKEGKERVRSANINSGLEFSARRITVNLAPADLPKAGGSTTSLWMGASERYRKESARSLP